MYLRTARKQRFMTHFTDKNTEAQAGDIMCPGLHSSGVAHRRGCTEALRLARKFFRTESGGSVADRPPGRGGEGAGRGSPGIRAALGCWGAGREGRELFRGGMCEADHGPSSRVGCWGRRRPGRPRPPLKEPNMLGANRPCSFQPSLPPLSRPRRGNLTQNRGRTYQEVAWVS